MLEEEEEDEAISAIVVVVVGWPEWFVVALFRERRRLPDWSRHLRSLVLLEETRATDGIFEGEPSPQLSALVTVVRRRRCRCRRRYHRLIRDCSLCKWGESFVGSSTAVQIEAEYGTVRFVQFCVFCGEKQKPLKVVEIYILQDVKKHLKCST